jgi:hypothetical protein
MPQGHPKTPLPVASWILLCAFFNCAGWLLSAIHQLNFAGYFVAVLIGLVLIAVLRRQILCDRSATVFQPRRFLRRFRRPFAFAFFVLAILAFAGGVIHAPSNLDGLAYRTPRVLHWLAAGQWHWIHTGFGRLNTRTSGFEWLTAPLIIFTHTDRLVFLINIASFLLLPGLIFSVMTRVGVRPRVAWHWMWLIPSGYCYLLQAGSIVNDMFGAVFALAAVDFALRARESHRLGDALLSILALSLMTGAKASNLPLALPWLIAFLAAWRVWLRRPLALAAICLPALACSFVPNAILNGLYTGGDWSGASVEHIQHMVGHCPAWVRLANNSVMDVLDNLVPPVFPLASQWNRLADRLIPPGFAAITQAHFETGPAHWELQDLQIEENAGLGFGVTVLFLISIACAWLHRRSRSNNHHTSRNFFPLLLCLAPWIAQTYVMCTIGFSSGARYMAPFYPLMMMGLLRGRAHTLLVAKTWWRWSAGLVFTLALFLLVISPDRPLVPAQWALNHLPASLQSKPAIAHAIRVYSVFGTRSDAFAPVRAALPADASIIGLITFDDPETSLWRPFGSRRIRHVLPEDSSSDLRHAGIRYIAVGQARFAQLFPEPFDAWLARVNGRVISTFSLDLRAGDPPFTWFIVELTTPASAIADARF